MYTVLILVGFVGALLLLSLYAVFLLSRLLTEQNEWCHEMEKSYSELEERLKEKEKPSQQESQPNPQPNSFMPVWPQVIKDAKVALENNSAFAESEVDAQVHVYNSILSLAIKVKMLINTSAGWDEAGLRLIEDMEGRDQLGFERYGVSLQPFNGRNALLDAYEELLDASVYMKQKIIEVQSVSTLNQ